jgi:hypothetical protein
MQLRFDQSPLDQASFRIVFCRWWHREGSEMDLSNLELIARTAEKACVPAPACRYRQRESPGPPLSTS